jgi:hypothetical protein
MGEGAQVRGASAVKLPHRRHFLTEAEVIEAEEELKALQRHAFAIVDPKMEI